MSLSNPNVPPVGRWAVGESVAALLLSLQIVTPDAARLAQEQAPTRREIQVTAKRYAFAPSAIEVFEGDVVKVTLVAEDIPHSFTIDDYRIAKRANPGHTVVFEFRTDKAGTFPFYCNLSLDDGCRAMRGQLRVRKR
ncbi:MAG: cupredoxin domain-containing protein [Acidobacteria bacterium]|nr:cupredoxin domain-containing protein [Acidobacteriota bacterium]